MNVAHCTVNPEKRVPLKATLRMQKEGAPLIVTRSQTWPPVGRKAVTEGSGLRSQRMAKEE